MMIRNLVHRVRKRTSKSGSSRSQEKTQDAREHQFGLFTLRDVDTSEASAIDIVAVHGLGGHRTRTWQHPETKAYWLQDFVPSDIENARVLVYGYNSTVAFSKSTASLDDFARDLLERLSTMRQDVTRPVIFICHSMGGLVVKKALILAGEQRKVYGALADATLGVLFLGTPHRGSSIATPAELFSNLLRAAQLGTGTNTKLVKCLRQNSEILWDISCQFVERATAIYIRTFYETEPLPFMNVLIVDKNSAVLHHPSEVIVPMLNANHRTMCQYPHRDSANYALIRAALKDLSSREKEKKSNRGHGGENITRIIKQFEKSNYEEYKAAVKPPLANTWTWILRNEVYISWLQDPSSCILWISGDPGCGKTTLSSFIINKIGERLAPDDESSVVLYFFFDGRIASQSDGAALLFALIHQLLKVDPALAVLVKKHLTSMNSQFGLSLHNLCEIFRDLFFSPERRYRRILCVLDAVDDCESASMAKVMTFLSSVQCRTSSDSADVGIFKLLLTTRNTHAVNDVLGALGPRYRIDLADHAIQTAHDVSVYISAGCAKVQTLTHCSDGVRRAVEKHLTARSDNTFLWVHLVLEVLETATDATPESFEEILRSVPGRLDELYDSILRRSAAPDALIHVLSVIAASRRPLTLEELNVAVAIRPLDTRARQVQRRFQFDIVRRLRAVCGPFIRIVNGYVSFIHQTAAEFLVRPPRIPRPPPGQKHRYKWCLDEIQVNRCMAEICIVYLSLADAAGTGSETSDEYWFSTDLNTGDSDDDRSIQLMETNEIDIPGLEIFFDYAAKYWGPHSRLGKISCLSHSSPSSSDNGGASEEKILEKIATLCDTSSSTFRAWFQLYWNTISTVSQFPERLTPLIVASHIGLPGTIEGLLKQNPSAAAARSCVRHSDSEGWTALHWAVWNGDESRVSRDAVALLLQHSGDDDASCSDGLRNGATTNIETRIVDLQDKRGYTALHWAAADGQVDALRLLLEAGATVDVFDQEGMTPLAVAIENEFEDAVELLLEYGADVNAAAGTSGDDDDDGYDTEMGSEDEEGMGGNGRLDEKKADDGDDIR